MIPPEDEDTPAERAKGISCFICSRKISDLRDDCIVLKKSTLEHNSTGLSNFDHIYCHGPCFINSAGEEWEEEFNRLGKLRRETNKAVEEMKIEINKSIGNIFNVQIPSMSIPYGSAPYGSASFSSYVPQQATISSSACKTCGVLFASRLGEVECPTCNAERIKKALDEVTYNLNNIQKDLLGKKQGASTWQKTKNWFATRATKK